MSTRRSDRFIERTYFLEKFLSICARGAIFARDSMPGVLEQVGQVVITHSFDQFRAAFLDNTIEA